MTSVSILNLAGVSPRPIGDPDEIRQDFSRIPLLENVGKRDAPQKRLAGFRPDHDNHAHAPYTCRLDSTSPGSKAMRHLPAQTQSSDSESRSTPYSIRMSSTSSSVATLKRARRRAMSSRITYVVSSSSGSIGPQALSYAIQLSALQANSAAR